jgi:FtsZ-binding cell division protein ZapB
VSAISGFCEKCNKFRKRHCDGNRNTCMSILFDTIEALQQENNGWRERYDELDAGHSRLFKDFCKLQQENEQLRAQVARMMEALESIKRLDKTEYTYYGARARNKNGELPPDGERWKTPMEIAMGVLSTDIDQDYHNSADVEALRKAREALIDYKTFLESFQCTCEPSNETYPGVCCERCCRLNQAKQALAAIDKAIGGGDVDKG